MEPITYAIIEDQSIFRQGLKLVLEPETYLHLVWEADSGSKAQQILELDNVPDILLLDIKMRNGDGIELLKWIKANEIKVSVIVLTIYDDDAYMMHLLELGAKGYLLKDSKAEEIIAAIKKVKETGHYYSERIQNLMINKITGRKISFTQYKPDVNLTERQREILILICQELTTAEIAVKLNLSKRRVESLRQELLNLVGVRNTAGLVVYAIKRGYFFG
jgi:DNA-binding NarL/FixJ family response regulator